MAIDDFLEHEEVLVVFNNDVLSIYLSIRKSMSSITSMKVPGYHVTYPVC